MITSKLDYNYYKEADRIALGIPLKKKTFKNWRISILFPDYRWKYQKLMRHIEYRQNCKQGVFNKLILLYLTVKYQKLGLKLLINIYPNTCGPGLSIAHHGPIRISKGAKIGANCRIHISTNIGIKAGTDMTSAKIGDNVYIGPGVKFVAAVNIPNNTAIGANSVITKSFYKEGTVIAGIPAKVVKEGNDTRKILIPATELMEKGISETQFKTSSELYDIHLK